MMTANRLPPGAAGRVTALAASEPQQERLYGMGVLPGVQILRSSGSPDLFEVQGRRITLRSREAAKIIIE